MDKNVIDNVKKEQIKTHRITGRMSPLQSTGNLRICAVSTINVSGENGFRDYVEGNERVTIVSSINVNSTTEEAKEATIKMLDEHPEINSVVTLNEWTSLGVGYAVQELGAAERTRVVAFDSNVVSVGMLETGEVDALVVQNPYAMGYLGVEYAWMLVNGEKIKETDIDTTTTLITKENMYDTENQKVLFSFD